MAGRAVATRRAGELALGASTRGEALLLLATKAAAAFDGRDFATPDDVKGLLRATFRHRLIVRPEAEVAGRTADSGLDSVIAQGTAPRIVTGEFGAGGAVRVEYQIRPPDRGAYHFGRVDVRWRRRRGLWLRQARVDLDEVVAVYPNVLAVREYELRLRRGMLALTGLRRAKPPGATTAFSGLRDYVRGYELRRISWKASARADRPVTTVVEAERGQQAVIVIDCARLMTAPAGELTKLDHAVNAALLLAWVAQSQGGRVGLMSFSDRDRTFLSPCRVSTHVRQIRLAL